MLRSFSPCAHAVGHLFRQERFRETSPLSSPSFSRCHLMLRRRLLKLSQCFFVSGFFFRVSPLKPDRMLVSRHFPVLRAVILSGFLPAFFNCSFLQSFPFFEFSSRSARSGRTSPFRPCVLFYPFPVLGQSDLVQECVVVLLLCCMTLKEFFGLPFFFLSARFLLLRKRQVKIIRRFVLPTQ